MSLSRNMTYNYYAFRCKYTKIWKKKQQLKQNLRLARHLIGIKLLIFKCRKICVCIKIRAPVIINIIRIRRSTFIIYNTVCVQSADTVLFADTLTILTILSSLYNIFCSSTCILVNLFVQEQILSLYNIIANLTSWKIMTLSDAAIAE